MFEKQKKLVDEKVIQPVKNAMAVAIAALFLGIVAIIVAVAK